MIPYKNMEEVITNLKDAGCDEQSIESFCLCYESGKPEDAMKLLQKHRCGLLDVMHQDQKKIDCLDYLVCQMKMKDKKTDKK